MKIKVVCSTFGVLLIFLAIGTNGRYTGKYRKIGSETNEESESFKNIIKFYRSQGRSADIGSIENNDNDKSAENVDEQTYGKYRIDLSSDTEFIPAASYNYEPEVPTFDDPEKETKKKVEVVQGKKVPTIAAIKTETTSESSVPNETKVPETIEIETTTEVPADKVENTERKILDDDAPPGFEIEHLAPHPPDEEDDEDEENDDESEECVEGKTKKKDCNTCVCVDGNYFCSKKVCTIGNVTTPAPGSQEKKHEELNQKVKDSWGKKKIQSSTPLPQCSSGQTKSIDCNQCICAMGKWACTKRSCIALTLREKASYTDGSLVKEVETLTENKDLDEDCSEGSSLQLQCNQCVCHLNSWSCTKLQCAPTPPPPKAEDIREACQRENDVKSRDCNLCKCTRGIWVCTRNDCKTIGDHDAAPPAYRSSSKITKIKKQQT